MMYVPPFRGFVKTFVIGCAVVFVLQQFALHGPFGGSFRYIELVQFFGLVPERLFKGLVFQVLTWIFLHGNLSHLLFNCLGFWMFGSLLEETWGTKRFTKFVFMTGILTGFLVALFSLMDPGSYSAPTIGASGVVFAILIAVSRLFPNQIVLFFFVFPMPMRYFAYLMIGLEFYALYSSNQSGVSNIAHLSGAAVGYLLSGGPRSGVPVKHWLKDLQDRWHQRKMRKKLRVVKADKKITYH
jgi:membrane associated rhomboid family serine protease